MALDALIGKVSLLAGDLPGSLEMSTACTGARFSVQLDRWRKVAFDDGPDAGVCKVPEQVLLEVVPLDWEGAEWALSSLHDRLYALIDLERAA